MNDQENSTVISILQEMKLDISEMKLDINEMKHSIAETNKRVDSLEEKIDSLEEKFDNKFDALEKKVDNNSANILKLLNTTSKMQKDISYLRDDIETVYSLEKDSRKHLKLS